MWEMVSHGRLSALSLGVVLMIAPERRDYLSWETLILPWPDLWSNGYMFQKVGGDAYLVHVTFLKVQENRLIYPNTAVV
jgi:hypothetical protein